ncbi:MAG: dihydropteroate synthase [Bacteroidota bacterium]|jgi:dihydropteroate synthase
MGILNATPDSYYAPSRLTGLDNLEFQADQLLEQGADWLDLGGCSTRPGATWPSPDEEWARLDGAFTRLRTRFGSEVPLSVDTFRSEIARRALDQGADLVNDISGGILDPAIWNAAADARAPYILTHYPSAPNAPLLDADTAALVTVRELSERLIAAREAGLNDVILDPGIGFGKTPEGNLRLVRDLALLCEFPHPLLVGVSRKSLITRTLGIAAADALPATSALHAWALERGAQILRVHDPREARQVIQLVARF